jgi:hypothetical protein
MVSVAENTEAHRHNQINSSRIRKDFAGPLSGFSARGDFTLWGKYQPPMTAGLPGDATMAARSYDHLKMLHTGEAIDRLLAAGIPIHQIEDLLDDVEHEEALHLLSAPRSQSLFGCLLWI